MKLMTYSFSFAHDWGHVTNSDRINLQKVKIQRFYRSLQCAANIWINDPRGPRQIKVWKERCKEQDSEHSNVCKKTRTLNTMKQCFEYVFCEAVVYCDERWFKNLIKPILIHSHSKTCEVTNFICVSSTSMQTGHNVQEKFALRNAGFGQGSVRL